VPALQLQLAKLRSQNSKNKAERTHPVASANRESRKNHVADFRRRRDRDRFRAYTAMLIVVALHCETNVILVSNLLSRKKCENFFGETDARFLRRGKMRRPSGRRWECSSK
jgi:hypothetical protein